MLALFNNAKNAGKISEALLIGRNLCNRNPGNKEAFFTFCDFLCALAESLPAYADKQYFAEQANVSLAFFSENTELDETVLEELSSYQQRISIIYAALDEVAQAQALAKTQELESHNSTCLKQLYTLKDALRRASTQEAFDKALSDISTADSAVDKQTLTEEQSKSYDVLTKECTDLISAKMRDLEYKNNISYNKQAADSFAKAFKHFQEEEGKYKNQTQLFTLASTTLFAYDASRLFNETLIYYNHVYSYIFSKLDDNGKLALTRFSIECERKLR